MSAVPDDVRREVVQEIYRVLDARRWEELPSPEKSAEYERMIESDTIGKALENYMDPGGIRVWIKDGPAKEYGRALEGIGSYVEYTSRQMTGPERIVSAALGSRWSADLDTLTDKPMRCDAIAEGEDPRTVMWGEIGRLKDLAWQCLLTRAAHPQERPVMVIVRRSASPLPASQRSKAQKIAELVGADFFEMQRLAGRKPAQ